MVKLLLISPYQNAFAPGRLIANSYRFFHVILHFLKNKRKETPIIAIKVDLNKV